MSPRSAVSQTAPSSSAHKQSIWKFELTKKKVRRKHLMHFCRQLSAFLRAALPIIAGLDLIASETKSRPLKAAITDMASQLRSGSSFAAAARSHPEAFAPYHFGMFETAELTGNLDEVLDRVADYIERDCDARSRLSGALMYPGIVLVTAIGAIALMATFVMPRFQTFFKSFHATLPLPTRLLVTGCHVIAVKWPFIIGGPAMLLFLLFVAYRTKRGRLALDGLILKVPLIGTLVRQAVSERVCRVLSSMLSAGVTLPDAISVAIISTSNRMYRVGLGAVREQLVQGGGFAAPVASSELFDAPARQILHIGEETGTLDEQLDLVAQYFDRELTHGLKRFTGLFEPAVILFVGLVVGFVAVALISAIYGIYNQVKV